MDSINFHNIANINCSKKETKDEDDKIFIYTNDKLNVNFSKINKNKNQLNEAFKKMMGKIGQFSYNASDIIKNKQFSHKKLLQKYSNIQAFKDEDDLKNINFKSIKLFNSNDINNIILNNHDDIVDNNDLNQNSRSSNGSKNKSFTEKKRKNQNDVNILNDNKKKEDTKIIFNDILNISKKISNIKSDVIKLNTDTNDLYNENEYTETKIIYNDKEIETIFINDNKVQKIHIISNDKTIINEKEILDNLKKLRKNMNKVLNKLAKNK